MADRVIILNDGKLIMDGTPEEVFSHQEELIKIAGVLESIRGDLETMKGDLYGVAGRKKPTKKVEVDDDDA